MKLLTGQCYCQAVTYAVNCHCSGCRSATGAALKPMAGITADQISVTDGAAQVMTCGDAAAHDVHCKICGSLLYSVVRNGAWVHVALGTLVDAPAIRPRATKFVGSKAPWFDITENLPQHAEWG